jgi:hypothetical protein
MTRTTARALVLFAAVGFVVASACFVTSGRTASAAQPCDRWYAGYDEPSPMDDPACVEKLRRDLRSAAPPAADFLAAEVVIGADRLAARAWHARRYDLAERYWRESAAAAALHDDLVDEPETNGIARFLVGNDRAAFRSLYCLFDSATCKNGGAALDEALTSYHIDEVVRNGLQRAIVGDYARAEVQFHHAAQLPCGPGMCAEPETYVLLGMAEMCAGHRARGIEHLIEASKRVGGFAPESPPSTEWADDAVLLLRGLARPSDLPPPKGEGGSETVPRRSRGSG